MVLKQVWAVAYYFHGCAAYSAQDTEVYWQLSTLPALEPDLAGRFIYLKMRVIILGVEIYFYSLYSEKSCVINLQK